VYAQEVGLDPDRTIQDFIAELPPEAATAAAHSTAVEDGEKLESDRRAVATALRLALVSLPIIGLVIYYGAHITPAAGVRPTEPPAASSTTALEARVAPPPPVEPVVASHDAGAAAAIGAVQTSGLSMELSPRATCWVSINTDGEQVFSGLMHVGDRRLVTAKEQIALNVGDAGAFAYTLNGRSGKSLGAPGEVVSTRITLANLHEFLTP
jgi:Domain of unknown function (DUF4115)